MQRPNAVPPLTGRVACVLFTAIAAILPATARADSGILDAGPCRGFSSPTILPTSGTVPSDAAQVVIASPLGLPISSANVFVTEIDAGGVETPLSFTLEILDPSHTAVHPAGPLAAGVSLRVTVQPCAADTDMASWPSVTLSIAAASTPPLTLGPLHLVGPATGDALVTYELAATLDATAIGAYGDAWSGTIEIDGAPYPAALELPLSVFAPPSDDEFEVFLTCGGCPAPGGMPIAGGHHTITVSGGPWGYPRIANSGSSDVDLECPPPSIDGRRCGGRRRRCRRCDRCGGRERDAALMLRRGCWSPSVGSPCIARVSRAASAARKATSNGRDTAEAIADARSNEHAFPGQYTHPQRGVAPGVGLTHAKPQPAQTGSSPQKHLVRPPSESQ